MRVLVVGSGGREHALCWAIAASPLVSKVYCAPGNPGIAQVAECVSIGAMEIPTLVTFARREEIDLVVPGPEGPLVAGITDAMLDAGIDCCGPSQTATRLESSKTFAKSICHIAGVPTASWRTFDDAEQAKAYVREAGAPIVIKADGLAAGKGVVVAGSEAEALLAIEAMMERQTFGKAGASVVIEQCLVGEEVSFFALCDGTIAIPLGAAQDHKRLQDGDVGPNTGGMGAYSPPRFSAEQQAWTMQHIILPVLTVMAAQGRPYRGVLFAGLMVTEDGIKLIEFNARFGDPECQALVLRMRTDLVGALCAACDGTLDDYTETEFCHPDQVSLAVVLAAQGYPETPRYGGVIRLPPRRAGVQVFHAGTERKGGELRAAGGRVLTVCATSGDLRQARERAYATIDAIDWADAIYRRDIGCRGLS